MVDGSLGPCFTKKSLAHNRVNDAPFDQHLDGNLAAQLLVERQVHRAHAPGAEDSTNPVRAERTQLAAPSGWPESRETETPWRIAGVRRQQSRRIMLISVVLG